MSERNRLEVLWEHYLRASPGTYERSSFLDVFLALVLHQINDGKTSKDVHLFCASTGVTSLIACDLLAEVHTICSQAQPSVGDEVEDLSPLRKYLLHGPGWRILAALHHLGVQTLSCGKAFAGLLITIYPLTNKPDPKESIIPNPYILGKQIDMLEDILPKPTVNRRLSHAIFTPNAAVELNRSQSNTSTYRQRRRRSTHSCGSPDGDETSESEKASDDPAKGSTLKIRLDPMDFDYFTSVVRSEDEARLESENYSPKKKVVRDVKKNAHDFIDKDIRDVFGHSLALYDLFVIVMDLLLAICSSQPTVINVAFQPVCIITLNFATDFLCSLEFSSLTKEECTRMYVAERKAAVVRILVIGLEKALTDESATKMAIQRGVLPVMLKVLEDVVRRQQSTQSKPFPEEETVYSHDFVFGLTYGVLIFMHNLLVMRGNILAINEFIFLFDMFGDSLSGRLMERSILVVLSYNGVDRQLQLSRACRLIEYLGHFVETLKRVRTELTNYTHVRGRQRLRPLEAPMHGGHHHQFLFGAHYMTSLTDSVSKSAPECSVASSFGMLIRLLRSLPPTDTEVVVFTIDVMTSCGTCCCFPANIVLQTLVQVMQKGSPKTRLMCLAMLERALYAELGAFESPGPNYSCVCNRDSGIGFETAQEYWSCLEQFSEMLLSSDAKLRHAVTSHLLRVAPRFSVSAKWKLLFGVFYPVFLKAKARLAGEDKLEQYTVLSCLSLFTSLLWTGGFAQKFNRLHGLDEILELIVTPTLSELCCSILEITAIADIGSLENAETNVPNVTSVVILEKALASATSTLLENISLKSCNLTEVTNIIKEKNWAPSLETDYRNLSIADILKLEGCVSTEESYLLSILRACVFWRSCANLTVASPRFCVHIGRELERASGHQLLRFLSQLISAGTTFTEQRCHNLEMHLYIKLMEALLTIYVAFGLIADQNVANANESIIAEVCVSLLLSGKSTHIQQICDALITSSLSQGVSGGKPRPAPLMVALPAQPDSLSDDEVEETYMTADEGYDADVEVLALAPPEGTSGINVRSISHPRLATVAVQLMIVSRRPSVVVHGLHRLIAVAREDAANCLGLADTGLINMLLEGFHDELTNDREEHDELRKVVLELFVILGRNRILPDELIKYLRLFTYNDPPVNRLLDGLMNLASQCIPRPHKILAFPPGTALRILHQPVTEKGMRHGPPPPPDPTPRSSRLSCAMTLPISSELAWTPWLHGFAAGFWLSANSISIDANIPLRRRSPSTSSRSSTDYDSSDDEAMAARVSTAEQLHLFSIGTGTLMFEVWLDSDTLSITTRLVKGFDIISQGTRSNVLSPGVWNHVAFNVANTGVNKRNVIEVRIIVDGLREESIALEMPGLFPRRSGQTDFLLGSASRPFGSGPGLRSWYLGNMMLFRAPIWTRNRALYVVGLGPNYSCLAECATNDQLPNYSNIFAQSLSYGVTWDRILEENRTIITALQEKLLLTYSPHSSNIMNLYPLSTHQVSGPLSGYMLGAGTATAASEQIPITLEPTLHSEIDCRQYQGLAAAATILGGAPIFLFLFARVVELKSSQEAQANAVNLLLKLVHSDSQLFSQFINENCDKLILRVLCTKSFKMGFHFLKAILDNCCDKPVIVYHRGTETFHVLAHTDAILVSPGLLSTIIACWCSLNCESDVENSIPALLYTAMLALLRDEHPFRAFNVGQMTRVNVVESVLIFTKEQFLYKENVPMPLALCNSMVELVRCLMGSPPDFTYIAALMDAILLLHSAQATYVTHAHTNFFCLLHSKGTTKSENAPRKTNRNVGEERESGHNSDSEIADTPDVTVVAQSGRHCMMEGLIMLVRDSLLMTPDNTTPQVMEQLIKMPILIVLANHPDPGVRAAVILLISTHIQRSHPDDLNRFIVMKGFYLIANQLGLHDATEKVVDACMWLVTCCQVTLRDLPSWVYIDISLWAPQSFVLLLALLPVAVRNVSLAHNLTLFLRTIFVQDYPEIEHPKWNFDDHIDEVLFCIYTPTTFEEARKMLLDLGLLEVLLKTIVAVCHVKRVCQEDSGVCDQDLLVEEIRVLLIAIVTDAVYALGSNKMQMLTDMCLQLGFLEQRERKECTDSLRCVNAMRDTQCMILEAALDAIQSKIIALEPKASHNVTNSSVLMLAASLRINEEHIPRSGAKQRPLSRSELGERYNVILVKAVEFLISSESVGECSSMEHSFARRLFSTMLRAMCSILDRSPSGGYKSAWGPVLWSARNTLRSQTSFLLTWMVSPENLIGTRLFAVTTLRGEPKLKEFMREIFKYSYQVVDKVGVFLWELINNNADKMQSPDKRCCEDLRNQLQAWNLMSSSYGKNAVMVKDLVELLTDEMVKSRRMWHSHNNSAMLRSVSRFEELLVVSQKCALDVTKQVVDLQDAHRKAYMEKMKAAFSENVQIRMQWATVIQHLTHERAVWYFPEAFPNCWQLDPTEGPGRVRTRLTRCHLKMDARYLMEGHPHAIYTGSDRQPLSYLFTLEPDSSASSVLIERLHNNEQVRYMSPACVVTPAKELPGELLVGEACLYFVADNSELALATPDLDTAWNFREIEEVLERRFQLKERAVEIFLTNGTTYLVAFQTAKERDSFLAVLGECELPNRVVTDHLDDAKQLWREGLLTNWDYLTQLNKIAGRSYNDLMQYPVFPFVLSDYVSTTLDVTQPSVYRNFKKPMAVQDKKNEQHYITNYNDLPHSFQYQSFDFLASIAIFGYAVIAMSSAFLWYIYYLAIQSSSSYIPRGYISTTNVDITLVNFIEKYFKQELLEGNQLLSVHSEPYHYGSHYSNSGTVLHFMVRLPPFTSMFLTYQDKNFDLADRTFHSMNTTWRLASSESTTDVKELIPEFFYLPEFLMNKELFNFGVRQNGILVNDVELPAWCGGDARLFVLIHRQALEAGHVRENLPHWLDLIFGFKQTGKAAIDAINVFHPATYCGFEAETIVDPLERSAWETMVKTYGQTPRQLLKVPHPMVVQALAPHTSKSAIRDVLPYVKGLKWGSYVGSPADLEPTIVYNSNHLTPITAFEMLPNNEVFGLAQSSSLLVSFARDKGIGYMNQPILQGVALITWGHADYVLRIKIKKDQIPMPIVRVNALDPVTVCATTAECNQLWMGHESGKIVVYRCRMELGKSLVEFTPNATTLWAHSMAVTTLRLCLAFSVTVSGSVDNTLIIWDLNKLQYVRSISVSCSPNVVTISPTMGDIAVACDNTLHCYTVNASPIGSVTLKERITALCYSNAPEGISVNVIAAGLASGLIRLWSSWDVAFIRDLSTSYIVKPIACITYSADGQYLYAAAVDGAMVIWERPGAKSANKSPKFSNLTFL